MENSYSTTEDALNYKDLDELQYDEDTLKFLRKKLDYFTVQIFKKVVQENKQNRGLVKSKLENYQVNRKKYDNALLILEAQGFVERDKDGPSTPYYLTVRGLQLGSLLKLEEKKKEVAINDNTN